MTLKPKLQRPPGMAAQVGLTPPHLDPRFEHTSVQIAVAPSLPPQALCTAPSLEGRPIKLILLRTFLERAQISRSYYYALKRKNAAPLPVKLATGRQGAVRLVEAECEAWLADLVRTRPVHVPADPPCKKT